MTIGLIFFFFLFYHIFAHIHAMVLRFVYQNVAHSMLSNGIFYLPIIYAFLYELQVANVPHLSAEEISVQHWM